VLPLLVRPSAFLDSPLARFQAFNAPELPVMKLSEFDAEELFVKVGADR